MTSSDDTRSMWARSYFKVVNQKYRCQVETGVIRGVDGVEEVKRCHRDYSMHKSTNLIYHLRTQHNRNKSIMSELAKHDKIVQEKSNKRAAESIAADPPSKRLRELQPAISSIFMQDKDIFSVAREAREELSSRTAMFFAVNDIALRVAECKYFQAMLDSYVKAVKLGATKKIDGRAKINEIQKDEVLHMKQLVHRKLAASANPTTLAYDGWTNINHVHVQNVLALSSGYSFFIKSDISKSGRATAVILFAFLKLIIDEMIEARIVIAAAVADNASVNGVIGRLIVDDYPWILPLPCAAHALQLCVLRFFKNDSLADSLRSITRRIHAAITYSAVLLGKFRSMQAEEGEVHHLHKPQKTRWNSFWQAFFSLLRVQRIVRFVLVGHELERLIGDTFWSHLKMITDFLAPFRFATNIIQGDHAGLLDVYLRFQALQAHIKTAPAELALGAKVMDRALRHHWNRHVHTSAVFMCAKFSCEDTRSSYFTDEVKLTSSDWFMQWAAKLWCHSRNFDVELDHNQIDEAMKTITAQYNKFIAQVRPFDSIRERIILARPETVPEVGQKTAPFDVITEWRKLEDVVPELVHGVIALLSANCSEASV